MPFRETPIAEDLAWGREALLAGHRIVYAADAVVLHSHHRSARYEFLRTYFLHRRLHDLFDLRTIPTLAALIRAVASSTALHLRLSGADEPRRRDRRRAIALGLAWPAGQYLGGLSAARRWKLIADESVKDGGNGEYGESSENGDTLLASQGHCGFPAFNCCRN